MSKELIDALEKAVVELKKNAVSGKIESIDPHAENKALYEKDAKVHKEPWKLWEFGFENSWTNCSFTPSWANDRFFRRKQTKQPVDWSCPLLKGANTDRGELLQFIKTPSKEWCTTLHNFVPSILIKLLKPADEKSNWQAYNGEDLNLLHSAGFVVELRKGVTNSVNVAYKTVPHTPRVLCDASIAAYRVIAIRDGFTDDVKEVCDDRL